MEKSLGTSEREEEHKRAVWVSNLARWENFFTGTFKWEASQDSACRCFERFMRRLLPGVAYYYAAERHPGGHGHHIHAVLGTLGGVRRTTVWKQWFQRYGRARLERARRSMDTASYCAKYLTKDDCWWNTNVKPKDDPGWKKPGELGSC